jgi:hypothetical protein
VLVQQQPQACEQEMLLCVLPVPLAAQQLLNV